MSWSRDGSRERELVLRPASSFSSETRQRVPMWDSSDPDRAPPPLPLNPGLQQSPTKPNTGATVAAAAEALLSRARESMSNTYQQNSPPKQNSEQSLLKGTMHKRMQSFQQSTGGVKDLSLYRENVRSCAPSPEKAPPPAFDLSRAQERSPARPLPQEPLTPVPRQSSHESTIRTIRPDPRPILGEPSPKSATMRALERGSSSDVPTLESQRDASSSSLVKATPSFDAISSQISGLTSIATNLQREMSQLSKRSKDNASDLVGLKEATNARDEDIRKSLRELIGKLNTVPLDLNFDESPRGLFLENQTPSKAPRTLNPSLISSTERELSAGSDGSAAIALLEKILREMGTKDGQERLLASFSDIKMKNGGNVDNFVSRKLDDVLAAVRDSSQSRALVKVPEVRTASAPMPQNTPISKHVSFDSPRNGPKSVSPMVGAGVVALSADDVGNDDMMKLLKRMKDSISESGCFTAEIKTLVRELRGEVLGMGREIAKQLEQSQSKRPASTTRGADGASQDEIAAIVEKGLADLHTHMDAVIDTHRRQSSSIQRKPEELDQIAHVVQNALKSSSPTREITIDTGSGMQREDILDAVKEAWEAYKPEIHSQSLGLGREEIMQCLQEGLSKHRSSQGGVDNLGPVYGDVLAAVRHGLKDFNGPSVRTEATVTREEILETIRDALEEATLGTGNTSSKDGLSHGKIMEAIRDGVALRGESSDNSQLLNDVRDLFSEMKGEILDNQGLPSSEGLSTLKTDLQALKSSLDSHAIRADPASNHELLETIKHNLDGLRSEIVAAVALIQPQPQTSSAELLDAMEREFEHLRASLKTTIRDNDAGSTLGREEILDAMREGVDGLKELGTSSSPGGLTEIKEELEHLRTVLAATLTKQVTSTQDTEGVVEAVKECLDNFSFKAFKESGRPESVISNTNELLDAFQDGVDSLKVEMQALKASVSQDKIEEILRKEVGNMKEEQASKARPTSRDGGAVMLADQAAPVDLALMFSKLETKFETLGKTAAAAPAAATGSAERDTGLHEKIDILLQKIDETRSSSAPRASTGATNLGDVASKDDVEAIETLLRNTRAKLDEAMPEETNLGQMADLLRTTRDAIDELAIKQESDVASKHDVIKLTAILMELSQAELANAESRDLLKTALAEHGSLNVKTDISVLAGLLRALTDDLEAQHELTAQAFEARKTEHGGLADKIEEIRVQLEAEKSDLETKIEVQTETMAGLMTSMTTIGELLGVSHEHGTFAEFYTTVQKEFENLKAREVLAKEQTERDQATLFEKYDAQKDLIVEDLSNKIDVRLDEILIKYDDAQLAAEARTAVVEERNLKQEEVMIGVKSTAEDLKLLVDGLGQSVTASCDKMSEDSKVVFSSIEQLSNQMLAKIDSTSIETGREHMSTREDIAKALSGLDVLQAHNTEHHPKLIGMAAEILAALVAVREKQDAHETLLQERKEADLSLPALPGIGSPREVVAEPGFDESKMHAKLDQIVSLANSSEHLAALDAIKQQVSEIAAEVTSIASVSNRAIAITEGADVDAELVEGLSSKRDLLTAEVDLLREEEKVLQISRAKLQADLSSLESALQIRREEMQLMEQRAEMLERRIIDGVLDHSHALLMSSRPQRGLEKLNLKRVKKTVDVPLTPGKVRGKKDGAEPISAVSNAIGMAMKSRPKALRAEARPASPADRRILSLSSAAGNRTPTSKLTPPISQKLDPFPSMKRSQSVNKKDVFDRKASWATTTTFQMLDEDKENGMQNSIADKPVMERDHSNSTSLRANLGVDSDGSDFSGDEYEETYGEPAALPASGKPGTLVVYTGPADSGIGSDLPTTAGSEKRFFEESVVSRS